MRLWWRHKKRDKECEVGLDTEAPEAHPEEAEQALQEIKAERKKIEDRQPFIDEISSALVRHYNQNNLSRLVEDAMRRRSR